jgi:hypothetical protein
MILLTDGLPTFPSMTDDELALLDPAVKRVVVGIGGAITEDDMRLIASRSTDEVFMVPTFGALRDYFTSAEAQTELLQRIFGYTALDQTVVGGCALDPTLFVGFDDDAGTGGGEDTDDAPTAATAAPTTAAAPATTAEPAPTTTTEAAACTDNFLDDCTQWAANGYVVAALSFDRSWFSARERCDGRSMRAAFSPSEGTCHRTVAGWLPASTGC